MAWFRPSGQHHKRTEPGASKKPSQVTAPATAAESGQTVGHPNRDVLDSGTLRAVHKNSDGTRVARGDLKVDPEKSNQGPKTKK